MPPDDRLESLLARYVAQRLNGEEPPDAGELCADHPELVDELRAAIAGYEDVALELSGGEAPEGGTPRLAPVAREEARQRNVRLPARLGPYRLTDLIATGGMGEVYAAVHTELGRRVAIKMVAPEIAHDSDALARFRREAKLASRLSHPHICNVYDFGYEDDAPYLVLEFLEGESLDRRLSRGPLPLEEALLYASQICQALEHAHRQGLVHRDLKPANVMLTPDGVKVVDFGLARVAPGSDALATTRTYASRLSESLTVEGTILGTYPYMSPEQVEGRVADERSDVFSFGVVLYEMVTGERPFTGDTLASLMSAILKDEPPPLTAVQPELPHSLCEITRRCLAKDPSDRFQTVAELRRGLTEVAVQVGAVVDRRRARLPRSGHWLSAAARSLVILVLVAAAGAALWLRDDVVRWMERETLAEATRLADAGDLYAAWRRAREVGERIPDDPEVRAILERISLPISIVTEPAGAVVSVTDYAAEEDSWLRLGETPLSGVRVPYDLMRWRIEKPGYTTFEGAPFGRSFGTFAQGFPLVPEGRGRPGMVRVPGGPYARVGFPAVQLDDYWLDRYEVTNREFKRFVDAGGYEDASLWTEPFVEDGRELASAEVRAGFTDTTGRPGPAGWSFGTYDPGRDDHPVSGVSWYEAAAYCRSAGKRLPTLYHWYGATAQDQLGNIVYVSNFGAEGSAPVGSHPGLGDFGTYDMAGNVKEWCWNEVEGRRYALGGGWGEPTYTFLAPAFEPPLARLPKVGFRCADYEDPDGQLTAPVTPRGFQGEQEPVGEQVFAAYRRIYDYDRTDLQAKLESVDESSELWRRETVSFRAAYGGERVLAHLFLPRSVEPPYQAVVWFPGDDVFFFSPDEGLASRFLFDFIPRSGRALVYPVYKGSYERSIPLTFERSERRDLIITWSKDLSRTVDYLEERPDIDAARIAYYGFSAGATLGPIFTAVESRFKASVLLAGGLLDLPPPANPVDFAPRSTVPTLMINGENDFMTPFEQTQLPLFRLLGAAEGQKRHLRLPGGHIPPDRQALIAEINAWLDRHLGPAAGEHSFDHLTDVR